MRKYNPTDSKITLDEKGNVQFTYEAKVQEEGPCWTGFKQVGTKMKNGKQVPNCVPIDEADMTAISSWKAKLKKMKGLTKQQMQMLTTLPTPVITTVPEPKILSNTVCLRFISSILSIRISSVLLAIQPIF